MWHRASACMWLWFVSCSCMLLCPLDGRLAVSSAWLWALLLLLESSQNLASISLLGAYLGNPAGLHAYGAVVKYSAGRVEGEERGEEVEHVVGHAASEGFAEVARVWVLRPDHVPCSSPVRAPPPDI